MKTNKPLPTVVIFAILTTITTFAWIGFEVYREYTKEPDPDVPSAIIASLNPILDEDILNKVVQSVYLTGEELGTTVIIDSQSLTTPEPVPDINENQISIPESATQTATESGTEI